MTTELGALLERFVTGVGAVLGDRLAGAYLQGSFALGEADEWSDVDFVVVTTELIEPELVQPLHEELYGEPTPWAQHLEGSYIPAALLRRVDPARTPVPFLDNGATQLVWDPHCNTAVVRTILREHGIVLTGPDPKELVDEVSPDDLRHEARAALADYAAWGLEPGAMTAWKQTYLVVTLCRILRTIEHGDVRSKRTSCEWALGALDGRWRPLVERAVADRPEPWRKVRERASPALERETRAFAESLSRR
jgi:hypothetical protein